MGLWIVLVAIIVLFIIWGIAIYNTLIKNRNKVKNAFAQIDTVLQRRFDLIPNLVETVKDYASHESDLLEKITKARTSYINASSTNDKIVAENTLTNTLKSLLAVVENYPELKADTNFLQLQSELSNTEDSISYARHLYNDAVTIYNNSIATFPNSLIANMFHFQESQLFTIADEAKEVPKIQF
ncbi:MAG: LemA family protein [Clostridia bacterium]|nr:LemA family protein [Clostridia bacterium]